LLGLTEDTLKLVVRRDTNYRMHLDPPVGFKDTSWETINGHSGSFEFIEENERSAVVIIGANAAAFYARIAQPALDRPDRGTIPTLGYPVLALFMRRIAFILIPLAVLWIGYAISPYVGLYRFVRAVESGDAESVVARVDFDELRSSLMEQLVRTYLRRTRGDKLPQVAQNVLAAGGASIADPIIAKFVTPQALSEFLRDGWPRAILAEKPPSGFTGVSTSNLGTIWQLFVNSEIAIGRFRVSVPAEVPRANRFGLRLHLSNWTWKIWGIELPELIQTKLAEEIIKARPR
jgi:hypothetical protein